MAGQGDNGRAIGGNIVLICLPVAGELVEIHPKFNRTIRPRQLVKANNLDIIGIMVDTGARGTYCTL